MEAPPRGLVQVAECRASDAPGLAVLILLFLTIPAVLHGQNRMDPAQFESCATCISSLEFELEFGDPDGGGMILADYVRISHDPVRDEFIAYPVGGTTIQLFGRDGQFIRAFGSEGDGPGEFRRIVSAEYHDGTIIALDRGRRRWIVISLNGDAMTEASVDVTPGPFRRVGEDTVVVGSVTRSPDAVGFPLHLVDIRTGQALLHFGSEVDDYDASSPYSRHVLAALSRPTRRVWVAHPNRFHLEEWSTTGEFQRVLSGRPTWFPPVTRAPQFGVEPPPRLMHDVMVDARGRLWTATQTPDRRWRDAVADAGGGEPDALAYRDLRIDLWDFAAGIHGGPLVLDQAGAFFIEIDGRPMFYRQELDARGVPVIRIYRLTPS